jgi:hypothetical protein
LAGKAIWAISSVSTAGVQQLPPEDAIQSPARIQTAPPGKFLYICDTLDMCEWDVRVVDMQEAGEGDELPMCVGGRGAAPPEFCGGPTGYRLMIKRQREGSAMSDPVRLETGIQIMAESCPEKAASKS